ncbi:GumC family protein [Labrenzia sp. VG12]|uniref:GumC family protein n=1 Tax=Labrenzia sp. VG12 TaxID=2021862 RepID=UPI0012FD1557|nr:GumC family protein [Labrenzia sp. VG12]
MPSQDANNLALDVLGIVGVLRQRILFVFLIAFVFVIGTVSWSLTLTPIYQATSQVLYDPTVRQPFDEPNRPSRFAQGAEVIDSQISVINSDTVLRPVVRRNNLTTDPVFNTEASPGLISQILGMVRGRTAPSDETMEAAETAALEKLSDALVVKRVGQTYVINVSVESPSPTQAAVLSNAIAESYLSDQSRQVGKASKEATYQIDDRLVSLRERLRQAESDIQRFRAENKLQSADQGLLLNEQELSGLNSQLVEARAALAEATAKNDEIQRVLQNGVDAEAIGDVVNSGTITRLREQFAQAARNEAELLADLLPSHPSVIRARSQLQRIRGLIREEVNRIAESTQIDLKVNQERVGKLEEQIDASRNLNNADSAASIKLRELETEAQATRSLYEIALARAKQISELDQVVLPFARIITPAVVPDSPVWPKKKIMVVLAGILGVLVGTALAVGAEAFRIIKKHLMAAIEPAPAQAAMQAPAVATPAAPVTRDPDWQADNARAPSVGSLQSAVKAIRRVPQQRARGLKVVSDLPWLTGSDERGTLRLLDADIVTAVQDAVDQFYANHNGPGREFGRSADRIVTEIERTPRVGQSQIVFLTSPALGHGQTVSALALALAAAQRGMDVLLADGEPKQRMLSHDLSLDEDALGATMRDRVVGYDELDISFLSLVSGLPKYKHHRMNIREAFEFADVARDYDLVIIDGVALPQLVEDDPLAGLATSFLVTVAEREEPQISMPILSRDLLTVADGRPAGLVRTMTGSNVAPSRKYAR